MSDVTITGRTTPGGTVVLTATWDDGLVVIKRTKRSYLYLVVGTYRSPVSDVAALHVLKGTGNLKVAEAKQRNRGGSAVILRRHREGNYDTTLWAVPR